MEYHCEHCGYEEYYEEDGDAEANDWRYDPDTEEWYCSEDCYLNGVLKCRECGRTENVEIYEINFRNSRTPLCDRCVKQLVTCDRCGDRLVRMGGAYVIHEEGANKIEHWCHTCFIEHSKETKTVIKDYGPDIGNILRRYKK